MMNVFHPDTKISTVTEHNYRLNTKILSGYVSLGSSDDEIGWTRTGHERMLRERRVIFQHLTPVGFVFRRCRGCDPVELRFYSKNEEIEYSHRLIPHVNVRLINVQSPVTY